MIEGIINFLKRKKKPRRLWPRTDIDSGYVEYYPGSDEDFRHGIDPVSYHVDHKVLKDYYKKSEWTRACVDKIITEMMAEGWELYSTTEEPQTPKIAALMKWFEKVNPDQSLDDIMKILQVDWLVTGDAYLEIVPNKLGQPLAAYTLDPKNMKIKVDKHGRIVSYVQSVDGDDTKWIPKKIRHWVYQPRSDSVYGLSPLETLIQTAAGDLTARDYNNLFFKNQATPRLHVDLGVDADRETLEWYSEWWKKNMHKKPHKTIFTVGDAKVSAVTGSNKDAEFIEFQKLCATKIAAVYDIPPIILGLVEKTRGFNIKEQREAWRDNRIKPLQRSFADGINKLIDLFGENFKTIRFRFKDKPNMQDSVLKLKHGLITINEWRAEHGLDAVEWGNKPLLLQKKGSPGSAGEEGLETEQEPDKERDVNED